MEEFWKDIYYKDSLSGEIIDYRNLYQVSNLGRIRNSNTNKILKATKQLSGYLKVSLYKNKNMNTFKIHRLVAHMFLIFRNIDEIYVNHKDENKENNNVDNLEWCTQQYNINYGTRNERAFSQRKTKIQQFDIKGNLIATYDSQKEAEEKTGISQASISRCCQGKRNTAGGYIFKFYKKEDDR